VLWLLLKKLKITGVLAAQVILATVITTAGLCDALRDDTGLVAAITMGIILANLRGIDLPEDRPFLKTIVQLAIGTLFIAISATVTPASLRGVIWPALALVVLLVVVVRPAVAAVATVRTSLTTKERIFIGSMDPRGIVAASTAASFSAPLAAMHIGGAAKLLPATFLVIVGTVAIYGLAATPLAKALGLHQPEPGKSQEQPVPEPEGQPR
jgi:NhaP-type Na+/H+ or K+/H+ antiporter